MIESILIKNFRGIQTGRIEGFRKFNLLVGPNNSGKSAVLEAIYLSCVASRGARLESDSGKNTEYFVKLADRDFLGNDPTMHILARHSYERPQVKLDPNDLDLVVSLSQAALRNFKISQVAKPQGKEVDISLLGLELIDNVRGLLEGQKKWGDPFELSGMLLGQKVDDFVTGRLVYCWDTNLTYNRVSDSTWIVTGQLASAQHTLMYDVFTAINHLPMEFFRKMIVTIPGWMQKIASRFSKVFGIDSPFNVQFLPTNQRQQWVQGWIAPEDQIALTIDSYGDGARSVFKALTPLIALAELAREDAPGLFIWEEPELFQNPQTLKRLLTEVAVLLKDKPVQVCLATHSLEVVANFVRLVEEGQIAQEEMQALRLNLVNGKLSCSAFDQRDIQDWTEMDLDLRVPSGKADSPLAFQFRETVNGASND